MENEEIKGNKSAERDVDSRAASESARDGLFNEAMKELGMPDGKPKPTNDDQGSQSESGKNKTKDQQAPAPNFPRDGASPNPNDQTDPTHKRQLSVDDLKNNGASAKNLHDSIQNSPEYQRDNGDKFTKNQIDPSVLKDNGTKLDEMIKNPIDPSVLKDTGTKLDEIIKNPIDPSILKEIGERNLGDDQKIDPSDRKTPIDVNDLKGLDKQNIGELLKELSMRNHEYMKPFGKGGDGDHILPTGDRIQRKDGQETLTTPNGDTVTVNPDGTFRTTGDVRKMTENKDGTHTITYGDGSKVTVGRNGIEKVERGNDRVKFHDLRTSLKADGLLKQINPGKPRLIAK